MLILFSEMRYFKFTLLVFYSFMFSLFAFAQSPKEAKVDITGVLSTFNQHSKRDLQIIYFFDDRAKPVVLKENGHFSFQDVPFGGKIVVRSSRKPDSGMEDPDFSRRVLYIHDVVRDVNVTIPDKDTKSYTLDKCVEVGFILKTKNRHPKLKNAIIICEQDGIRILIDRTAFIEEGDELKDTIRIKPGEYTIRIYDNEGDLFKKTILIEDKKYQLLRFEEE